MKYFAFLFLFLKGIVAGSGQTNYNPELHLISSNDLSLPKELSLINDEFIRQEVIEENPSYGGVVLVSKNDLSIAFALVDSEQNVLWQKSVESDFIALSPQSAKIAVAGKNVHSGFAESDVPLPYRGVSVYDVKGNKLFFVLPERTIRRMEFNSEGDLIVLSNSGICAIDSLGKIKWNHKALIDEIDFFERNNFISETYYENGYFYKRLLNTINGNLVREWKYLPEEEVSVLYCNPERNELLVSIYMSKHKMPDWTVKLYQLNREKEIVSLPKLAGSPFGATWFKDKNVYTWLMTRPRLEQSKNSGEVLFVEWNVSNQQHSEVSIGYPKITFSVDRVRINKVNSNYSIKVGSKEFIVGE